MGVVADPWFDWGWNRLDEFEPTPEPVELVMKDGTAFRMPLRFARVYFPELLPDGLDDEERDVAGGGTGP